MKLTPEILRGAYAYLVETPPFCEWNLPDAEDVTFTVTGTRNPYGLCRTTGTEWGKHTFEIKISGVAHTQTDTLLVTMAHEMVHVHQRHNCINRSKRSHGADFKALAAEVCAAHGFDLGQF